MWQPDIEGLADELSRDFGLHILVAPKPQSGGWPAFELRLADVPQEISFRVDVVLGWRSVTLSLQPGAFAGALVEAMGEADVSARQTFRALAAICAESRSSISLVVNGFELEPLSPESWPSDWRRLTLVLTKSPAVVNTEDYEANERELRFWVHRYLSLSLALMPVEELEADELTNLEGLPEGARIRVETNRYERSRINRAACIEIHGNSCLVCDFNFEETFGEVGRGFVHVHHVIPVSQLGPDYRINPATDLIPLCPNCHAMAHQFDPPASVGQLRQLRVT